MPEPPPYFATVALCGISRNRYVALAQPLRDADFAITDGIDMHFRQHG